VGENYFVKHRYFTATMVFRERANNGLIMLTLPD
jgi:hypothetical protein